MVAVAAAQVVEEGDVESSRPLIEEAVEEGRVDKDRRQREREQSGGDCVLRRWRHEFPPFFAFLVLKLS